MKPKHIFCTLFWAFLISGCSTQSEGLNYHSQGSASGPTFRSHNSKGSNNPEASIPYRVEGKTYYPLENANGYSREGIASWYGPKFHGKKTSNGEIYNMHSLTAAHKTLPFNTRVQVTNKLNKRSVVVRINDRGPFVGHRIIDLSYGAGVRLGMVENGTVPVRITVLKSPESGGETVNPKSKRTYTVQVGVFKNLENAQRMAQKIGDGEVMDIRQSSLPLYRVVTTAYNTFDRAQNRMDDLRRQGHGGAFVIALPGHR